MHYEKFADGTVKCIEDEIPFDIPDSWVWTRLNSVGEIITGTTPSKNNADFYGGIFPFFKPTDLDQGKNVCNASEYLTESGKNASRTFPAFSTSVCCIGSIGKSGFLTVEGTTNQQINTIVPFTQVNQLFVYYFVCTDLFQNQLKNKASATTVAIVNKNEMSSILFALPPFNQQVAIVNILEQAFDLLQEIEKDKDDIIHNIVSAKSRILDLAIRGKLVTQDPNDEPASVLLERIKAEKEELIKRGKIKREKTESAIFKGEDNSYYDDIPENWAITTLNDITTSLTLNDGDWILSENMDTNGTVKLVQLGSVGFMQYIDKGFKYITDKTFDELKCTQIYPGYLLVNRIISDKMNVCILPDIDGKIITTVDTCWIAPQEKIYSLKFILYMLSSPKLQSLINKHAAGTTRKRISKNNLINLPFLLPPLAEQNRIVETIEKYFDYLDNIAQSLA